MSVLTFIQEELAKVKALFVKEAPIVEDELEEVILPAAITITGMLKTVALDDTEDTIGKATFGAAGQVAEEKAKAILPELQAALITDEAFLQSNPTTDQTIIKLAATAQSLTGDAKAWFLIQFSAKVAMAISDGKLTLAQSVIFVQALYAKMNASA